MTIRHSSRTGAARLSLCEGIPVPLSKVGPVGDRLHEIQKTVGPRGSHLDSFRSEVTVGEQQSPFAHLDIASDV